MRATIAILLLALAAARAALGGDARFLLPQDEAFEGSPIQVIVEVNDASKVSPPTLPEIPGASVRVTERGRQSRTEIINGRMRNSTTVTYAVEIVPEAPGKIEIPAIEVMVDGSPVRSQPKVIEVKRSDAGDLLSAEVFGQPPEVTIGQPLELVLRIAIKPYRDVTYGTLNEAQMWQLVDVAGSEWGIFEPEITELRQRNAAPRSQQEVRDGQRYYVFEVSRRTWPPKAGSPDLGTIRVRMTYPLALREVQSFFLDRQLTITQSRPLAVAATADGIAVLPLPEEGRPASFTGAVGTFTISVTAKPTNVGVGDPVTLTLAITDVASGANLETLQPPALSGDPALTRDFRVPSEAISGVVTGNTKRFTVTVRPLRAGTAAIPPIEFSSYDPKSRSYVTARSQPVPITVVPGSQLDLSKIVSAGGADASAAPADPTTLTAVEGGLVANLPVNGAMLRDERASLGALAIAGLAFPPAAALAAIAWRMNRARHERDGSLARRSSARRTAERRLRDAADAAAIASAVTGFVEDATGRPQGTVTRGDLEAALAAAGAEPSLRERARDLLSRCERARYAGGGAAVADLVTDASALVDALEAAGLRTKGGSR